jgi:MFS family permease
MSPGGKHPRNFITVKEGLKMRRYWHFYAMAFFSAFYGLYMASVYKTLGLENDIDDLTLTWAGSLGSLSNGVSRFGWGLIVDKFGFKKTYGVLLVI